MKNTKGRLFLFCYKTSAFFSRNKFLKIIGFPIRFAYTIFIQWGLGIDIPDTIRFGKNFNVVHGQGLVINSKTVIGENVTVRQNTTIGNAKSGGRCPVIEDNVNIGANVVIIGDIRIGRNSIIGAGSVVIKDVPPFSIVAGNPAKFIKKNI
ncbi:MAG: serine O-acetyltransferase [Draconibacterium sp.]